MIVATLNNFNQKLHSITVLLAVFQLAGLDLGDSILVNQFQEGTQRTGEPLHHNSTTRFIQIF